MTASDARPCVGCGRPLSEIPGPGLMSCESTGCPGNLHWRFPASDARPPSDTGTTGWCRHDYPSGPTVVFRHAPGAGLHDIQPARPVLVVDPAEARETIAWTLRECEPLAFDNMHADWAVQSVAGRILAALAGQEQP